MKYIFPVLISLLILSLPVRAQMSIKGQVTDKLTGVAIPQAKVEAASKQTLTGADGTFVLQVTEPGDTPSWLLLTGMKRYQSRLKLPKVLPMQEK